MANIVDVRWDDLVTKDFLDARLAQIDTGFAQIDTRFAEMEAKFEASMRSNTFRLLTTMFASNGALVAAMAAIN